METIKYLNARVTSLGYEGALEALTEDFGIKVTHNEEYDLYVLNYSQIDSPKTNPIVMECRSLVLGVDETGVGFYIVSRSFDRFLNLGEDSNEDKIDITEMVAYEKLDGSLIGLFYHKGQWLYRTKSMIMPSEDMHMDAFGNSWKGVIDTLLETFHKAVNTGNFEGCKCSTFILELTSPYNRIVTRYKDCNLHILAVRENANGYYRFTSNNYEVFSDNFGWRVPKKLTFDTIGSCKQSVEELPNLEEGFVLYDIDGTPKCKIKSSLYLAVHRIRGESIPTPKRIMDLVFTNETDEYLTYFKEDTYLFEPYMKAYEDAVYSFNSSWEEVKDITDQKEFALSVKGSPMMHLMFRKKQNNSLTFRDCFDNLTSQAKYRLMESYLNE